MADKVPSFRPSGWRERKPWKVRAGRKDRRLRGRAGQRARAAVLAEEPFCRVCLAEDKHVRAEVVDHIVPLSHGGGEELSNKQALCHHHHDEKSAEERARGAAID
jgi:5-methylcytosine-specific restriction protein A